MKPGNSVEDKTLRIGTGGGMPTHSGPAMPSASLGGGKSRTKGDRNRAQGVDIARWWQDQQTTWGHPNPASGIPVGERRAVMRGPVQAQGPTTARPSLMCRLDYGVAK